MLLAKIVQIFKQRDTTAMFEWMQDERNRREARPPFAKTKKRKG